MVSKQLSNVFFKEVLQILKSTESSKFLCYGPLQIFVKTTAT